MGGKGLSPMLSGMSFTKSTPVKGGEIQLMSGWLRLLGVVETAEIEKE